MFFKPKKWNKSTTKMTLSKNINFVGVEGYARDLFDSIVDKYGQGENEIIVSASQCNRLKEDGYKLEIQSDNIKISYSNNRAIIYAVATIKQMIESDEFFIGTLTDSPDCKFRGYKVYLPGHNSFDDFYKMVDIITELKYNYISLEIGGAMEYKRHPEINKSWKAFAEDTHRYSARTYEIQMGYPWSKDSIHTDNGEGDILSQDEMRTLINYCRYRGLEVFPEVPSFSHSDYICLAHPDLAERKEDPYPDTYCPSNPKSYKILFDILDEVIEVFNPKIINIGHDELYSFCLCPKCRKRNGEDVFTDDVTKIHDYLASKGIKCAMWCDKLFPAVTLKGTPQGGSAKETPVVDDSVTGYPATYLCQAKLPKDIMMMNWYYGYGMEYDFILHRFGYPAIFANMSVAAIKRWRLRIDEGMMGGSVSNWGSLHEEYMQRNCQYANLSMGAYAMWTPDYDSTQLEYLSEKAFNECYRLHFGNLNNCIEVTHSTDKFIPYKVFYDGVFIENHIYHMGKYVATYEDNTTAEFEVKYGTNIMCENPQPNPHPEWSEQPRYEICYSAIPVVEDGKTWFKTAYKNPYPNKKIVSFEYVSDSGDDVKFKNLTIH